jgi:hypothetical protein
LIDLVFLHEHDTHFNLVISEDSILAKFGSLSHRFYVGPIEEENDVPDESKAKETESNDSNKVIVK